MTQKKVVLTPYDPEWVKSFHQERDLVAEILGDRATGVHHIGSTSIPGLSAKPIIDIMPTVTRLDEIDPLQPRFEERGFVWRGENGIQGRRYVVRERPDGSDHLTHIHIFEETHFEVARHLAFRDHLLANAQCARDYNDLKIALASKYFDQRARYQELKSEFIEATLRTAMGQAYVDSTGKRL